MSHGRNRCKNSITKMHSHLPNKFGYQLYCLTFIHFVPQMDYEPTNNETSKEYSDKFIILLAVIKCLILMKQ